jgi:predicted  nucleic acid-binding Zn-ribbon protein
MTRQVEHEGESFQVLQSDVYLEISNTKDQTITIRRSVIGERDIRLISVWHGPALSDPSGHYDQRDFFVRDPGSASREAGFHTFLTEFCDWQLPKVSKFDGSDCPLYAETIFPLMFVEQKSGWSAVQSNIPTYFGIREVAKRAIEFILNLEAYKVVAMRQRLEREQQRIKSAWTSGLDRIREIGSDIDARIHGVPSEPTVDWPPRIAPTVELPQDDDWLALDEATQHVRARRAELTEQEMPTAADATGKLSAELSNAQANLSEAEIAGAEFRDSLQTDKAERSAINLRLKTLEEDLIKNRDARKLKELGSEADLDYLTGHCPTCHQSIADALLVKEKDEVIMSIDENIAFIKSQQVTFRKMLSNIDNTIEEKEKLLSRARYHIQELRMKVRAIRQSLTSDGRMPSIAAVQERLQLDSRLNELSKAEEDFQLGFERLGELSAKFRENKTLFEQLPVDLLSESDQQKVGRLTELLRDQLGAYEFSTFSPGLIDVSWETYKPIREGFEIGFELSASDSIRLIWAYLLSLLEFAREYKDSNHLGCLFLDEPRQQETAKLSFVGLLRRAAESKRYNQQLIFATSEEVETIFEFAKEVDCSVLHFDGPIIRPVDQSARNQ